MDNGEHRRLEKKRKFDVVYARRGKDTDDPLNLSLHHEPYIPTPFQPLQPPQESDRRPVYVLSNLNSPRKFPRPPPSPPSIPDNFPSFPSSTRASTSESPQLPPLSTEIHRPLHPTETRNSPRISSPESTPNFAMLPPRPSSSQPPRLPGPSLSQETSGTEDGHPRSPRSWHADLRLPLEGKSLEIVPPYRWATTRRATVYSIKVLFSFPLYTITGYVHCKTCGRIYLMGLDLSQRASELFRFIIANKIQMHKRAPAAWMMPTLTPCSICKAENSAMPIISEKKRAVNWLFLLLGQMLGSCTVNQLEYFCKHTQKYCPLGGDKNQLLYLTYMGLCKQLDPDGPFDP